jgi:hypothetical protein
MPGGSAPRRGTGGERFRCGERKGGYVRSASTRGSPAPSRLTTGPRASSSTTPGRAPAGARPSTLGARTTRRSAPELDPAFGRQVEDARILSRPPRAQPQPPRVQEGQRGHSIVAPLAGRPRSTSRRRRSPPRSRRSCPPKTQGLCTPCWASRRGHVSILEPGQIQPTNMPESGPEVTADRWPSARRGRWPSGHREHRARPSAAQGARRPSGPGVHPAPT